MTLVAFVLYIYCFDLFQFKRAFQLKTIENGQEVFTIVYVVRGETESLLGLKDAEALGIINIDPKGKKPEVIRQLDEGKPLEVKKVSEEDKREMEEKMQRILEPHEEMFHGIGVAKVDPVHIEIDKSIKPVQQKRRPIALHYQEKFREHIEELQRAGVVSGPLKSGVCRGMDTQCCHHTEKLDEQEDQGQFGYEAYEGGCQDHPLSHPHSSGAQAQLRWIRPVQCGRS